MYVGLVDAVIRAVYSVLSSRRRARIVAAFLAVGGVVVGLTDRWRREGLGRARTALATAGGRPTVLVRRGLRPGGLSPRDSDTRFTWTIGPAGF